MSEYDGNKRKFVDKVPGDIRRAVNGLAGENKFAVLALLLEERGASFSQIKSELQLHQQSVSNALDSLQSGGIVKKQEAVEDKSYSTKYEVTQFGHRLMNSLLDTVEPRDDEIFLHNQLSYQEIQYSSGTAAAFDATEVYAEAKTSQGAAKPATEKRDLSSALSGMKGVESA